MKNFPSLFPSSGAETHIWAIGGGKGGVGKTIITSNLAISLARLGKRVVCIDADLGGANLHTVLGIPNPKHSLTEFLTREAADLTSILTPTFTPNLWLISGARALMEMANPKHAQKEKLIRKLADLDMDYILLDLGAGTSFNIIDFFLAAEEGILVVVPEPTSIENAYHFLKSAFYRRLKRVTHKKGVAEAIDQVMEQKLARGIRTPRELIENVRALDPAAGEVLALEAARFTPRLVVNQISRWEERDLGTEISNACANYFGIEVTFVGSIERDDRVSDAIRLKKPPLELYPASPFARSIQGIARKLVSLREAAGGR